MIAIVDYGVGNLGSVKNMFKKIGASSIITNSFEDISNSDKIILPGVGSFDTAIQKLRDSKLIPLLEKLVLIEKKPILGICLGMQLMTKRSDEGKLPGLGWLDAETLAFKKKINERIPHMGWNEAHIVNDNKLTDGLMNDFQSYFVHSYYVKANNIKNVMLQTNYNITFDSGIFHENIFGVQFHPEKSHKYGLKLLENFYNL